jgi:hypothetical protein
MLFKAGSFKAGEKSLGSSHRLGNIIHKIVGGGDPSASWLIGRSRSPFCALPLAGAGF